MRRGKRGGRVVGEGGRNYASNLESRGYTYTQLCNEGLL